MDRKRTLKWLWSLWTSSKSFPYHVVVAVQWPSRVRLFATPWTAACQASLSLTISQSLPKFMFIALVMPSFPSTLDLSQHPMSHLLTTDDQNSGASASASELLETIHGWSPLRLIGLISLLSKGLSGVFSITTVWRHQFFGVLPSLQSSSHNCMWQLGRP